MNKKPASLLSILIIVPFLFLLGCATSSGTELLSSPEVVQSAEADELPAHHDDVGAHLDKEPLVESQEEPTLEESPIYEVDENRVIEKPLGKSSIEPTTGDILLFQETLVHDVTKDIVNSELTSVKLSPLETQNVNQHFRTSYGEINEALRIIDASSNKPLNTVPTRIAEPKLDSVTEEPIQEHPSMNTVVEIERPPMQTNIFFLGIIIVLLILLIIYLVRLRKVKQKLDTEHVKLQEMHRSLDAERNRILVLGIPTIEASLEKQKELKATFFTLNTDLFTLNDEYLQLQTKRESLQEDYSKLEKRVETQKQKLARAKELYKAIEHAVERFHETEIPSTYFKQLTEEEKVDLETFAPSVILNLNYMNYQDIRKEFRANQKQIDMLLEAYATRYTTKANQSIYKLMVISLRSELQNILYNLKYEKLDNALLQVQSLVAKYLVIISEGNQQVASTMRKFVGELEHLFGNAVKIEYEYYIKKEQARQEQLALRQQMREEAEERRRLEEQKKQIALEESKYQAEIDKVREMLNQEPEDSSKRLNILAKLDQLNAQLTQVEEKKEEISKLQNGKAGNVYIISNLGSFGEHVFKIGMTRRLDPQERVDELGSASVPFKFDVHSFIFSEDAVGLESELHQRLHTRRLNKVNLRKEFFDVSIEELEQLVEDINPTAEFTRTMLASDFKQSLSLGEQELPLSSPNDGYHDQEDDQDEMETGESEIHLS